jgi:uncharacterized repeat protein (TIGR03803 family)
MTPLPTSGVTLDPTGNLYGVTQFGGSYGSGDVYELTPSGSGWTQTILYSFDWSTGGPEYPSGDLIFGELSASLRIYSRVGRDSENQVIYARGRYVGEAQLECPPDASRKM